MSKILGDKIGVEVCEILGLPSDKVSKIDILIRVGDVVHAEITRFVEDTEMNRIKEVISRYKLTDKEDISV